MCFVLPPLYCHLCIATSLRVPHVPPLPLVGLHQRMQGDGTCTCTCTAAAPDIWHPCTCTAAAKWHPCAFLWPATFSGLHLRVEGDMRELHNVTIAAGLTSYHAFISKLNFTNVPLYIASGIFVEGGRWVG